MKDNDPLDIDQIRLAPDLVAEPASSTPRRIRKRRQQFAMVPRVWVDILTRNSRDKTLA